MVKSGGEVVRSVNFNRISPPKIIARFLVLYEKSLGREIAVAEPEPLSGDFLFSFLNHKGLYCSGQPNACSN